MLKRKILSALLAGALAASMLGGCGADGGQSSGSGSSAGSSANSSKQTSAQGEEVSANPEREPYTVKIIAHGDGTTESCSLVAEELSKITREKFNTEIELVKGYTTEQLNLVLTSGEKLDIFPVFSWETNLANFANNDQLTPLNDLLENYGKSTLNAIGENDWKCVTIGESIYGVPCNNDNAMAAGVLMRKDVVDELKIDTAAIKTMEDLEKVLTLVKEKKPDMYPMISSFGGLADYTSFDGAGNNFGVLENIFEDSTKFVNYYETEGFKKLAKQRWDWAQKGLIMPDATSNTEDSRSIIGAGKGFCSFFRQKPGVENQESAAMGTPVVKAELFAPVTNTDMVGGTAWSIPANSEKPDRAMEVLDLLYSDPAASNLFSNGVEGTHYVYTDDTKNVIDYPQGKTGTTIGYSVVSWASPNQQNTPVRKGDELDLWEQLNTFNKSAKASPAMGFAFNSIDVMNEITACQNVIDKYEKGLQCGALNPDETLDKFNGELKEAGLQTIIDEKQKQFDAWLAAQK